jgi:hypothetical protein
MILFEGIPTPAVRAGELEVASRRVAVRAFPYAGEVGGPFFRFDPVERRFFSRAREGTVVAGPADADAWRTALLRGPAGPVLVGPSSVAEEVRGVFLAAAEGARQSGRAVYLLEPDPAGLPGPPASAFSSLFVWFPGSPDPSQAVEAARRRGIAVAVLVPLVSGWTANSESLEEAVRKAGAWGASSVSGISLLEDGLARRLAVEAAAAAAPQLAETLFDRIHHPDSAETLKGARERLREACARRGLACLPSRPVGAREPAANAAAAARLEEKAQDAGGDEHRASLLHAAARWLDESARDLGPIAREGNLPRVFPFGPDLVHDVEEALRGESP